MGWLCHKVKKSEIVAGDHIYTWRSFYAYSHHGIYMGENKVVHFTSDLNFGSSSSSSSSLRFSSSVSHIPQDICPNLPDNECGFRKSESGVILSCLDCFLSGGSLCRYQYSVSKFSCIAKRVGTCTTAKSDPPKEVINRTMYLLLQHGFGNYNMLRNNCEDFALYCKTGLLIYDGKRRGISSQAGCVALASKAAMKSSPLMFFSGPAGLTLATGIYYMNRSNEDIGVRTDVAKVKVEHILDFLQLSI